MVTLKCCLGSSLGYLTWNTVQINLLTSCYLPHTLLLNVLVIMLSCVKQIL